MSKKITIYLAIALISSSLFTVSVNAQTSTDSMLDNLRGAGQGAEYNVASQGQETALPDIIGSIIAIVLAFVGTIFLGITIRAGLIWMTAGGNEEKITKARTMLMQGIVGLVITVMAYFITWLITNTLLGS